MKDQYGFLWEEFLERYLINREEFVFTYKGIKIEFVCEGNCYPVVVDCGGGEIKQYEYKSPQDALSCFRIQGKTMSEIWKDLE